MLARWLVTVATLAPALLVALACGGGSPASDGGASTDASTDASSDAGSIFDAGADAGESSDGGAEVTECGDQRCDRATEICVVCACGGPDSYSCEPVPSGCAGDRTCGCVEDEVCPEDTGPSATCTDQDNNVVYCDTGAD